MQLTISLGDVLQIAATVVLVIGGWFRLRERLAVIETKVDALWERRVRGER